MLILGLLHSISIASIIFLFLVFIRWRCNTVALNDRGRSLACLCVQCIDNRGKNDMGGIEINRRRLEIDPKKEMGESMRLLC